MHKLLIWLQIKSFYSGNDIHWEKIFLMLWLGVLIMIFLHLSLLPLWLDGPDFLCTVCALAVVHHVGGVVTQVVLAPLTLDTHE